MAPHLTAYKLGSSEDWTLEPAPAKREWMTQTPHQTANRCLPLVIANQAGWLIGSPCRFKATWSGKNMPDALTIEFPDGEQRAPKQVVSIFGSGIISFSIPWLFRTSEGLGLLVRGPTNSYKDGVVALDGLVETDWAPYTFTMNWKVTKPRTPVWFKKGEPIAMLQPYPIALLEQLTTRQIPIGSDPELLEAFVKWSETRTEQYRKLADQGTPEKAFKLDYVRGARPDGTFAGAHWSKLKLGPFPDES